MQRHQRQNPVHVQENNQDVQRDLSDLQNEHQSPQVSSSQEVDNLRHELSQSLAEGTLYQNRYTTNILDASESSPEIQQLRSARDTLTSLTTYCRSWESEAQRCKSGISSSEVQMALILQ